MTVQEAIKHLKEITHWTNFWGGCYNDKLLAIDMAIEALEKQMALKNALEQIEELKVAFEAGAYQEKYCLQQMLDGKCKRRDCSACVLERAIEIIKEELM